MILCSIESTPFLSSCSNNDIMNSDLSLNGSLLSPTARLSCLVRQTSGIPFSCLLRLSLCSSSSHHSFCFIHVPCCSPANLIQNIPPKIFQLNMIWKAFSNHIHRHDIQCPVGSLPFTDLQTLSEVHRQLVKMYGKCSIFLFFSMH